MYIYIYIYIYILTTIRPSFVTGTRLLTKSPTKFVPR